MPTTYAHWRFGDKCLQTLPNHYKNLIIRNRDIFDYGVHGPDIFFYYNAIKHNDVNQYGTTLHNLPFKEILKEVKHHYNKMEQKDAALAYLIGFCCHWTLDFYCHGYIARKLEESNFTHARIETEMDRHFLVLDGHDPIKKSVTFSLKPNKKMAAVISQVFPRWDAKTIYKALSDQKFYLNALKDTNVAKRKVMGSVLNIAGAKYYKDIMMTTDTYPELDDAMLRLDKYFNKALEHFPSLCLSMIDYLQNGKALDDCFRFHFDYRSDYKEIPVLSLDVEKYYVVDAQY